MPNDDSFPWSEFPDHFVTQSEIEAAFDAANEEEEEEDAEAMAGAEVPC